MSTRARSVVGRLPGVAATGLLAAASGMHVLWGSGSVWPARDRRVLADLVAGTDELPGPGPCFAVAGLLAGAATVVALAPSGTGGRAARAGVCGVLAVRGSAGVAGATGRLVPWTPSDRFVDRDRRWYGPLCLLVAGLVAVDLLERRP